MPTSVRAYYSASHALGNRRRGVDTQHPVERAETKCRRQEQHEARQRQPAKGTRQQEKSTQQRESQHDSNYTIDRSDIGIHDIISMSCLHRPPRLIPRQKKPFAASFLSFSSAPPPSPSWRLSLRPRARRTPYTEPP